MGSAVGCSRVYRCDSLPDCLSKTFTSERAIALVTCNADSHLCSDIFCLAATCTRADCVHSSSIDGKFIAFRKGFSCGIVWPLLSFTTDNPDAAILWRLSIAHR